MTPVARRTLGAIGLVAWWFSSTFVLGQQPANTPANQVPGACETPVSQRTTETGCYVIAIQNLGALSSDSLFWYLDEYRTVGEAQRRRGPTGTVVTSFGRTWLFTIAGPSLGSAGVKRTARVGPLKTRKGVHYVARYMEATFPPGIQSRNLVHHHPGPEAWFVLSGTQCLETPQGASVMGTGQSGVVPEGPPMSITAVGSEVRRSIVLVLHDASQPWATMTHDWEPKGLCPH